MSGEGESIFVGICTFIGLNLLYIVHNIK
jgi:hypothetical protein